MVRAFGTGIVGVGLTLSSTFAGSLGLSVHQQRAGFVVGVALMLFGISLLASAVWRRRGRGIEQRRVLVEKELREIAIEVPLVTNSHLVFNKGAEDTPQRWMSSARAFVEEVQGPAAEARFAYSIDPQAAVIEIANGLDLDRLPSAEAIEAASATRRRSSGIYPPGIPQMVIPGRRVEARAKPSSLSPAERRKQIENNLYPPRDDKLELGEECATYAMKMGVVNEELEWKRERSVARAAQQIRDAEPDLDPFVVRERAKAQFERYAKSVYVAEWRDEALRLFDQARELGASAAKNRHLVENPHAAEMAEIPHLFRAMARRLGYEPITEYKSDMFPPPPNLAADLDDFIREGIALVAEFDVPVSPEKVEDGWKLEASPAPDDWWDEADSFARRVRELLLERHPVLLKDYADGYNAHLRKEWKERKRAESEAAERSASKKLLELANYERSGPRRVVEATLEGIAVARHGLGGQEAA